MTDTNQLGNAGGVCMEDLTEANPRQRVFKGAVVLRWLMVSCVFVLLAMLMVRGSQPALTPGQIVQLDSYQGEQAARRIFNITNVTLSPHESPFEAVVDSDQHDAVLPAGVRTEAIAAVNGGLGNVQEEVLASARAVGAGAMAKNRNLPAAVPGVYELPQPRLGAAGASIMLPLYAIVGDSVRLRESPALSARGIKTVYAEETITLFSTDKGWAEVAANDGSGITGYVPLDRIVLIE